MGNAILCQGNMDQSLLLVYIFAWHCILIFYLQLYRYVCNFFYLFLYICMHYLPVFEIKHITTSHSNSDNNTKDYSRAF